MARGVGGIGPANIMRHLKGIHFPASKNQILDIAKKNQGRAEMPDTNQVIGVLQKMDDREYTSVADIMKQIGKIE